MICPSKKKKKKHFKIHWVVTACTNWFTIEVNMYLMPQELHINHIATTTTTNIKICKKQQTASSVASKSIMAHQTVI